MSKRKLDQTGIDYSLKSKHIKKDNENHDDIKKIEKSINPKDKEFFNKANDILHEDALSESSSSSNNEICFLYKTTPDNSVWSCTQDEEEPEALESDREIEGKKSPLKKENNISTILLKSNELRVELQKNYQIVDIEADGNCFFRAVLYCIGRSD